MKEQKSAQTKFEQKLAEFDTRDKQQNIYGVKTMKQKRIEEDFRNVGPDVPVQSAKTENKLLQEVGANPYEKVSPSPYASSLLLLFPLLPLSPLRPPYIS